MNVCPVFGVLEEPRCPSLWLVLLFAAIWGIFCARASNFNLFWSTIIMAAWVVFHGDQGGSWRKRGGASGAQGGKGAAVCASLTFQPSKQNFSSLLLPPPFCLACYHPFCTKMDSSSLSNNTSLPTHSWLCFHQLSFT